MSNILPLDRLADVLRRLRSRQKTIVHCHGVFDLLHPGHIRHLEAAKNRGDVLVVTITRDAHVNKGPGRPVFSEQLRAESIAALGCVDYVAINDSPTAVEAIRKLRPHLYCKGADYRDQAKDVTGGIKREEDAARAVGAKLVITDEPMMSSSHLLNQHFGVYPPEARAFLDAFGRKYTSDLILQRLASLRRTKVLVVGEAIVDEYRYCQAMGKSPKETIVSTRFLEAESFAGGALATANHLAGFVDEVVLVTALGAADSREEFIRSRLKPNVKARFVYRKDAPTIVKTRFVEPAFLTKMFEVSHLDETPISGAEEDRLLKLIASEVRKHDLVLASDYGHGLLGPKAVRLLSSDSRFLAVNTQANSANHGYNVITKYPRADYPCVDEPEARLAARDRIGDPKRLAVTLARALKTKRFVVTRGHKGALAWSKDEGFTSIPVFSAKIVDRTGAGDAFLALSSLCASGGLPMDLAAFVGNAAGALKVGTVCNRTPVEAPALFKFVTAMLK